MAKQVLNNNESGLEVRNKINSNFTELYDGIDAKYDGATGEALAQDVQEINTALSPLIQNVKSIRVLTQSEYDALGVEKETDNTLYLING